MNFFRVVLASLTLALLSACYGHVYPETSSFIRPVNAPSASAETVHVFVDGNGTFYPTAWEKQLRPKKSWKADSLLNESAGNPSFRQTIEDGERDQLSQISTFAKDKKRIFILIHGYNNTMAEAESSFRIVEGKLDLRPDDGVVRFFWDGLRGKWGGAAKIWFNATGYSQMAGARGLRRVLAQLQDKEVVLISHSRGASVILSSLGNPIYDPDFLENTRKVANTWGPEYASILSPPPLPRLKAVHILMLAPAVDRIDFCDESTQPQSGGPFRCDKLRDLQQVSSLRYSVNAGDPTLNKFIGLSGGFNPTGLGLRESVGAELAKTYPVMKPYVFPSPEGFHGFGRYAEHPIFEAMLRDAGYLKD